MNCLYFALLLISLYAVSESHVYKFQKDRYLTKGCPPQNCRGERIRARCRMPTMFTHRGRRCRGCPVNICTNNILRTPDFIGSRTNVPETFNPLRDRAPKDLPQIYKAMSKGYLDQQALLPQAADVMPPTDQFVDGVIPPQAFDPRPEASVKNVLPAQQLNPIPVASSKNVLPVQQFDPREVDSVNDVLPIEKFNTMPVAPVKDVLPLQQFDPRQIDSLQDFSPLQQFAPRFTSVQDFPSFLFPSLNQLQMGLFPSVNEQLQQEPLVPIVHSGHHHTKEQGCLHS